MAKHWIKDEFFCVAWPDNIFIGENNVLKRMISIAQEYHASVIGIEEVSLQQVVHHGVVVLNKEIAPSIFEVTTLIEKPKPEEPPSRVVNCGRYVLSPKIF